MFKNLLILYDAILTPTSEVHMAAMLVLLIASNYKDRFGGAISSGKTYKLGLMKIYHIYKGGKQVE
jgi:hypothetical protein